MPRGRIGHSVDQRTDCFFPPLYPLTNIWSNGTVWACTYKSGAAYQGAFDVRHAPDSGAKADVAGGPSWVNRVAMSESLPLFPR
jgi:hypothetical protein